MVAAMGVVGLVCVGILLGKSFGDAAAPGAGAVAGMDQEGVFGRGEDVACFFDELEFAWC